MEVFIRDEDKDFIDACLIETNCYLYIQDELQGETLKLKSIEQHDKEVKKQVIEELRNWNDKCIDCGYLIDCNDLEQKLNELEGI